MSPNPAEEVVAAPTRSSGKKRLFSLVIIGGIMLVEGVGIFAVARMTGHAPAPAEAGDPASDPSEMIEHMDVELALVDCDAINRKSGQSIVVHVSLSVRVAVDDRDHVAKLIEKRQNTIKDRVQMILRRADPSHLHEPDLATLKRQVKFELDKILCDEDLVLEVLIPQILQSRSRL